MAVDLASFVKKGPSLRPPKLVVVGDGGIGKTTFAAGDASLGLTGPPNPIFAFTELGQGRLDLARFELREGDPVLRSWEEIMGTVEWLYSADHDYGTYVLDGVDGTEKLIHAALCQKYDQPKIDLNDKSSPFAFGRGYLYAADEMRLLLDGLDALQRDRNMVVVLLAHTGLVKIEPPDAEAYTQWTMRTNKRIADVVHEWCDAWLFATVKRHVVKDVDPKDKKRQRARGVSAGQRIMYTEQRPAWVAKNRYSLPPEMPFSWQEFLNAIVPPGVTPPPENTPTEPEPKEEAAQEAAA